MPSTNAVTPGKSTPPEAALYQSTVQPTGGVATRSAIVADPQNLCGDEAAGGSGKIVKLIITSSSDSHVPLLIVHRNV
ncbi:hypothetical protein ES705_49150 [subsurface metagenome]